MLYSYQFVTVDQIIKECNISTRTVYRYINSISEANIPVYFDRNYKGYRINTNTSVNLHNLSLDDLVYLIVGLKLLSLKTNSDYSLSIDKLLNHLLSCQKFVIDDYIVMNDIEFNNYQRESKIDELLNIMKIQLAISKKQKLLLHQKDKSNDDINTIIQKPCLEFANQWCLHNLDINSDEKTIFLKAINTVKILQGKGE